MYYNIAQIPTEHVIGHLMIFIETTISVFIPPYSIRFTLLLFIFDSFCNILKMNIFHIIQGPYNPNYNEDTLYSFNVSVGLFSIMIAICFCYHFV